MIKKIVNHLAWRYKFYKNITAQQKKHTQNLAKVVQQGPFKGLLYLTNSTGSVVLPKLIGTYKLELQPLIQNIGKKDYTQVIDIGAAEGYYAVGLAKKFPQHKIIAFEATAKGRHLIKKLASLNEVTNIQIEGICNIDNLKPLIDKPEKVFLLVDIEGAEVELLNPQKLSALKFHNLLVELHPQAHPDILGLFAERFSDTHKVQVITKTERTITDIEDPTSYLKQNFKVLTNEYRGDQSWVYLESLN